jgi:hypothetical protein
MTINNIESDKEDILKFAEEKGISSQTKEMLANPKEFMNKPDDDEFRLRYDEAGQFFFKEMELKRKYREEEFNSREVILV